MNLGELIRNYRMENNLSQRKFALRCGLSNGYIAMLERNENPDTGKPINPGLDKLKLIAEAMGITSDELIDMLDDEQPVELNFGTRTQRSEETVPSPMTSEARILSAGVNKMPEDIRKRLLQMVELAFAEYFKEESKSDDWT